MSRKSVTQKRRGPKAQAELNGELEAIILKKEAQQIPYTHEDLALFAEYTGAGGLGKAGSGGKGVLNEFYTPAWIVKIMWDLAKHWGFKDGRVLEPACGIGRIIEQAPALSRVVGFEMNAISAVISRELYPGAQIYNLAFETAFLEAPRFRGSLDKIRAGKDFATQTPEGKKVTLRGVSDRLKEVNTWLEDYPFDLVIMNPPYGIHRNRFSGYFKGGTQPRMPNIESFFLFKSLQLLRPGGLVLSLHPQNFLRNGITMNPAKETLGSICELLDAHRLPPVFDFTNVPTDLIVLQKR